MLGWGWLGGVGWGNNVLYLHTLLLLRQRLFSCYVIRTSLFFTCAFFYATLYFWCYFVRILLHFHIFNIMSLELMLRQDNAMLWRLRVRRSWLVLLLQSDATLLCKLLDATSQELLRSWHYARRPWLVLLLPRDHILPKKLPERREKSVWSAGRVAETHFLSKPFQRFCMLFWQIDFKRNPSKPPFLMILKSHESETFTNAGPLF